MKKQIKAKEFFEKYTKDQAIYMIEKINDDVVGEGYENGSDINWDYGTNRNGGSYAMEDLKDSVNDVIEFEYREIVKPGDTTLESFKHLFNTGQIKFINDNFGTSFFNRKFDKESSIDTKCGDYTLIVYWVDEDHKELFISATKSVEAWVDIDFVDGDYNPGELHHE